MNEQEAQRQAYLKAWFAAAGDQAAKFTDLTIEEIGIAREARAHQAGAQGYRAEREARRQSRSQGRGR